MTFQQYLGMTDETFGYIETPALSESPAKKHAIDIGDLESKIKECSAEMRKAAKELRFEDAARLRDELRHYQTLELAKADTPS